MFVVTDAQARLVAATFADRDEKLRQFAARHHATLISSLEPSEATRQILAYLDGRRTTFDLDFELRGTEFQRRAWSALLEIPYGETRSYAEQARAIGQPAAVRAVGRANGQNPLPLVVPCHRVVGRDGSLTGFGGGVPLKRRLLALEATQRSLFADV
ncbi:MAG: methylated-DNA--[protein]-cysteine S-methyltransferase [Myxococcales bacterium FL481]|nr:MAG: methylated-DNA--[protein]-cysteine S-methyltransferase [Myxococcales bacterium FL481]